MNKTEMRILERLAWEGPTAANEVNLTWRSGTKGRYQTINRGMRTLEAKGLIQRGGLRPGLKAGSKTYHLLPDGLVMLLGAWNQRGSVNSPDLTTGSEADQKRLDEILTRNVGLLPAVFGEWDYLTKSDWKMARKALRSAISAASSAIDHDYFVNSREGKHRKPGYVLDIEPGERVAVSKVFLRDFLLRSVLPPWGKLFASLSEDEALKWLITLTCRSRTWEAMLGFLEDEIDEQGETVVKAERRLDDLRKLRDRIKNIPKEIPELHNFTNEQLTELLSFVRQ